MNRNILAALGFGLGILGFTGPAHSITITYNDLSEQLLVDQHDDLFDGQFDIVNNTGVAWTDFHLRVIEEIAGICAACPFFPEFGGTPAGGYDGTAYEGPGTATVSNGVNIADILDVVGLNIADGGTLSFLLDVENGELLGDWNLFGTPTTDGNNNNNNNVPEPGSLLLFAVGLIGLAIMSRRRKHRVAELTA